jgi:hypothetical protein
LALLSAGLEAAYMLTLSLAYKNSDFSLVYPMAQWNCPRFFIALVVVVLA